MKDQNPSLLMDKLTPKRPRGQPKKRGLLTLLPVRFASVEMHASVIEFLTATERGTILAHAVGRKLLIETKPRRKSNV